jgi:glycolate oxidase iron-sulfur subunit
MQTNFTPDQLQDPGIARANDILRACVHCGMCTATCPTYQVLGDELDSPRGRIYLIKDMLEQGRPADARTVLHIDRCLSCLACMTTCPSGCTTCTWSTTPGRTSRRRTAARRWNAPCAGSWRG